MAQRPCSTNHDHSHARATYTLADNHHQVSSKKKIVPSLFPHKRGVVISYNTEFDSRPLGRDNELQPSRHDVRRVLIRPSCFPSSTTPASTISSKSKSSTPPLYYSNPTIDQQQQLSFEVFLKRPIEIQPRIFQLATLPTREICIQIDRAHLPSIL